MIRRPPLIRDFCELILKTYDVTSLEISAHWVNVDWKMSKSDCAKDLKVTLQENDKIRCLNSGDGVRVGSLSRTLQHL